MLNQYIVKIAVDLPLFQLFDYCWDQKDLPGNPEIGQVVKIEFGKKIIVGIVLQIKVKNTCADDQKRVLKPILAVASELHMTQDTINLCQFASKYYLKPLGEVLFTSLPADWKNPDKWLLLEKQKNKYKKKTKETTGKAVHENIWLLNEEQNCSLEYLKKASQKNKYELILLKGVTGSGKTAVYLNWLMEVLKEESAQCLILVPEINLTPQLEKVIKQVFTDEEVTILHSNITSAQRNIAWWKVQQGISRVVVGTRLSIFAPLKNLKAIVVDEEHDASYKQQDGLRYNARDLAIWRGAEKQIPVLLTSATPSSETWQKVMLNKISLQVLNKKAKEGASFAKLKLVDTALAKKTKKIDEQGIASELKELIQKTWQQNKQTLIYINRRGYAPILYCKSCEWKSSCKKCSAWMVVHKKNSSTNQKILQCHHCGLITYPPKSCPDCGNQDLETLGLGTQKIEEHFREIFPEIELIRVDSDSTKSKGRAEEVFRQIHQGSNQLIIGTQMIIKGHDFQNIQSIIVLDVDKSLYSQDFRAVERIFSQLVQVAGRAGRSATTENANIYIQTEFVDHPLFKALASENYDEFITEIVREREVCQLPPFTHQALIIVESKNERNNNEILQDLKSYLEQQVNKKMLISDPTPRVLQRLSGIDRNQILIESSDRVELQKTLEYALDFVESIKKKSRSIKISIDRDPIAF
jgi:primosomal protein N' (replication factor Y)